MKLMLQSFFLLAAEFVFVLLTRIDNTYEGKWAILAFTLAIVLNVAMELFSTYLLLGNYKYSATVGSIAILMSRKQKIILQRNEETLLLEVIDDQVLVVSELGPGGETKTIPCSVIQKKIAFDNGKEFFWVRGRFDYYGTLYWNVEDGWKMVN